MTVSWRLMSITCFNMTDYCRVQVLHVDPKSRLSCKLVILYVHMRRGDNRRQSQGVHTRGGLPRCSLPPKPHPPSQN